MPRMDLREDIRDLIGHRVVIDTMGTLVYLGVLKEVTDNGYWLADSDVHDCRDGHASREVYISEACRDGISVNRLRVFVLGSTVCSLSRLDEVSIA